MPVEKRDPTKGIPEHSYRECPECNYKPILQQRNCPNCGRDFIGRTGTIPNSDIASPRGRQYERDLPDDLDLEV